jgi:hypothetical protein
MGQRFLGILILTILAGGRLIANAQQPDSSVVTDSVEVLQTIATSGALLDTIGGLLPDIVTPGLKPYLVVTDLEVAAGKTVTIQPGVVFLFRNFTTLHVQGLLKAEGTKQLPIVFTSEFDRTYNPACTLLANPFDWNGIYLHENAVGSRLTECIIKYSVFGINTDTKFIRIDKCCFSDNGKSDFVIEGKAQSIAGQPFSYALTVNDASAKGVPADLPDNPASSKRQVLRYSGMTALLGGAALGVVYTVKLYEASHADDSDRRAGRLLRERNALIMLDGYLLGCLGALGFAVSFTF